MLLLHGCLKKKKMAKWELIVQFLHMTSLAKHFPSTFRTSAWTFYVFSPERKFSKSSNFGSADPLFEIGREKKKLHWQLLAAKGLMRIVPHVFTAENYFTNVQESISNRKRRASARTPKLNRSAENVQTATRKACIHGRRLRRLTCLPRCAPQLQEQITCESCNSSSSFSVFVIPPSEMQTYTIYTNY